MIVIHRIEVFAELVHAVSEGVAIKKPVLVEIAFWNPQGPKRSRAQDLSFSYYLPFSSATL